MAPNPRTFMAVCTRRGWVCCEQVLPCRDDAAVKPATGSDALRRLLARSGWPLECDVRLCGFSSLDPDAPAAGPYDLRKDLPAGALCVAVVALSGDEAFAEPEPLSRRVASIIHTASMLAEPAVARALATLAQELKWLPMPQEFDLGATSESALLRVVPHAYRGCVATGHAAKAHDDDPDDLVLFLDRPQLADLNELIRNPLTVENVEACTVMPGKDAGKNVAVLFVNDEPGPDEPSPERSCAPGSVSVATLLYLASDGVVQTACAGASGSADPLGVAGQVDLVAGAMAWPETPRLFGFLPRPVGSCNLEVRVTHRSVIGEPLMVNPRRPDPHRFSARRAVVACDPHAAPAVMRRARVLLQLRDWARLLRDPEYTARRPFQADKVRSRWSLVHTTDEPRRLVGAIVDHAAGAPESRIFGGDIALGHADDTTVKCILCFAAAADGISNARCDSEAVDLRQPGLGQLLLIDHGTQVLLHHRASPLSGLEAMVAQRGMVATPFTEFDNGAMAARGGSVDPETTLKIADHLAALVEA